MIKVYKLTIFLLLIFNLLLGCSSLKDGLQGKKKSNNSEEFLIDKKNPLVLPPDFSKLPAPETDKQMTQSESEFDLESILKENSGNKKKNSKIKTSDTLEKSIIEKINKD